MRVQPLPGSDLDPAVDVVVNLKPQVRFRPRLRVGAAQPSTVPARSTLLSRRARRRTGEVLAVVAHPHHDLRTGAGQLHRQLDRVVAAVEREQRRGRQRPEPGQNLPDLLRGHHGRVVADEQPAGVQRCRPRVRAGRQSDQPGVAPAGHYRLPGRVPRRVIVEAALR
jgi:hypothetical protein